MNTSTTPATRAGSTPATKATPTPAVSTPSATPSTQAVTPLFTVPSASTPLNSLLLVPFADVPLKARLNWDEKAIQTYATQMAKACLRHRTVLTDPVFALTPSGQHEAAIFLRACDARFWKRQAEARLTQEKEHAARVGRQVGASASSQYVSHESLMALRRKDAKSDQFLNHALLASDTLGRLPLSQVANTLRRKAASLYATLAGIEACANEKGLRWAMLTITLPPAYHANPKTSSKVPFNQTKAAEANDEIARAWARLRAQLGRRGIKLSGVRVCEGMADGTPHWHVAFFYTDQEQLDIICEAVLRQYPEGLRIRETYFDENDTLQSKKKRYTTFETFKAGKESKYPERGAVCQLDIGAEKTGDEKKDAQIRSCTGYVLKYVMKSLGESEAMATFVGANNERLVEDEAATPSSPARPTALPTVNTTTARPCRSLAVW